jgi:hypothetical protein
VKLVCLCWGTICLWKVFSALNKELVFYSWSITTLALKIFLILFLESSTRNCEAQGQSDPVPGGERALPDRELLPVSAARGLGHSDPGLPGDEASLACATTSAGWGTVPHRQVDPFLLVTSKS